MIISIHFVAYLFDINQDAIPLQSRSALELSEESRGLNSGIVDKLLAFNIISFFLRINLKNFVKNHIISRSLE